MKLSGIEESQLKNKLPRILRLVRPIQIIDNLCIVLKRIRPITRVLYNKNIGLKSVLIRFRTLARMNNNITAGVHVFAGRLEANILELAPENGENVIAIGERFELGLARSDADFGNVAKGHVLPGTVDGLHSQLAGQVVEFAGRRHANGLVVDDQPITDPWIDDDIPEAGVDLAEFFGRYRAIVVEIEHFGELAKFPGVVCSLLAGRRLGEDCQQELAKLKFVENLIFVKVEGVERHPPVLIVVIGRGLEGLQET